MSRLTELSLATNVSLADVMLLRQSGVDKQVTVETLRDAMAGPFIHLNGPPYNADNTGATNARDALQSAIDDATDAGGGTILMHGDYLFQSGVQDFGNHVSILGVGRPRISKQFNGNLFTLNGTPLYNTFENLYIDANGGTYTGVIVNMSSACQAQDLLRLIVVNGADTIISIGAANAGSGMILDGCRFTIHSSHVAAGAVIKNTGADSQASPRYWINSFGFASTWMYRGTGLQTFYAANIYSNGFDFTGDDTDAAEIHNCRMALFPQASNEAHFRGENLIITNCHFGGDIEVGSDFDNGQFRSNSMDVNYTFTDNSPSSSIVEVPRAPFYNLDHKVVDTAQLPAASTAMNGTILIENAGAGDRNLIIYAGGQRFRIDGGSNF